MLRVKGKKAFLTFIDSVGDTPYEDMVRLKRFFKDIFNATRGQMYIHIKDLRYVFKTLANEEEA